MLEWPWNIRGKHGLPFGYGIHIMGIHNKSRELKQENILFYPASCTCLPWSPLFYPALMTTPLSLSAAVTSLSSSGLKGICPSVCTSSLDEGSGVKKGRSREGPITVQLLPHSATRRSGTEEMDRGREREREKMTPPNPHLSCYWSIVLACFVWFGTAPPSALIWQQWLKVIMSYWWLRTSCYMSSRGGSVVKILCFSFLFELQFKDFIYLCSY